jgi:hypothetical protein
MPEFSHVNPVVTVRDLFGLMGQKAGLEMSTAMSTATVSFSLRRFTPGQAILWGGIICGALDATDGVVAYWLHAGLNPIQALQFIASGALGQAAFDGGLSAAGLGAAIHFLIAFVVAAIYVAASRWIPLLRAESVIFGLAFGAAVYLVMNFLVLPLSAVAPSPFSLAMFLNGVIGHALFVGLPISLNARRAA